MLMRPCCVGLSRRPVMGEMKSRFESQGRFDSNIARFDSSTMRFDTDSIQILTLRFKRHAILTEISKSWLKLNTRSFSVLTTQSDLSLNSMQI